MLTECLGPRVAIARVAVNSGCRFHIALMLIRAEVRRSSSHSNCRCAAQSGRGGDPAATAVAIAALGARAPANAMPDACHPCDRCAPPAPYLPGWSAPSTAPTVLLRCYPAPHPVCDEGYR